MHVWHQTLTSLQLLEKALQLASELLKVADMQTHACQKFLHLRKISIFERETGKILHFLTTFIKISQVFMVF